MKNDSVIKIEDLFFAHGKKEVLKGVSLEIPKGQIWGLVGPNGTGKTTLLKILAGLYKSDKGTVLINDVDMKNAPNSIYNEIGVMIEDTASYENLSGFENVKIIANMYNFDHKDEKIKELFKLADLEKAMYDKVKTYSLGMKQRLGLIMTLLNEPKVLLLDEPTNGLDIDGIRTVREIIMTMKSEYSTGFSSGSLVKLTASMLIFGTVGIFRRSIPVSSEFLAFSRGILGALFLLGFLGLRKNRKNRPTKPNKQLH